MKTKEQILAWLDRQPWKYEFYEAVVLSDKACLINYNKNFLHRFEWSLTKQGFNVWRERNEEYLKWYDVKDKPRSWEEYCDMDNPVLKSHIQLTVYTEKKREYLKCGMPDKLCEAFVAYAKLMQLRNAWIKNDEPLPCVHKIFVLEDSVKVITYPDDVKGLSFSSFATANDFIYTFKDLLEEAKPLL